MPSPRHFVKRIRSTVVSDTCPRKVSSFFLLLFYSEYSDCLNLSYIIHYVDGPRKNTLTHTLRLGSHWPQTFIHIISGPSLFSPSLTSARTGT